MANQYRICAGATLGAFIGAAVAYLFFTDEGRVLRERFEPAVDDVMSEFGKFRGTLEKMGEMATTGLKAFEEFQTARAQPPYSGGGLSH